VRLLLDTQAFLYWAAADARLPKRAKAAIQNPRSSVHLSAASIWEIRIKVARGSLRLRFVDVGAKAREYRFDLLPIMPGHAQAAGDLPRHHDDPFDRMLVAQARIEEMMMVTGDGSFGDYGIPVLWD
jgi:PIN domain nuclease of toxin-antitoxin system